MQPMTRREFSGHLMRGMGSVALAPSLSTATLALDDDSPKRQPNIVLILSDQHAYKYCGFMGYPIVRTPHLDKIAQQGVVFKNTYCGSPVCAPSRAGMLSGTYPSDCNSFCNATVWDGTIAPWPRLLREAGYHTFGTGKMDTNAAFDLGFDEAPNLSNGHATNPDITAFFRRPLCFRPEERKLIDGRSRKEPHKDAELADAAIAFIRKQPKDGKPWVVYCGPHEPHEPFVGREDLYDDYLKRVDTPNIPPGYLEEQHAVFEQLRHYKDIATPIPLERVRRARAAYYAMITELDESIGRIWATLEATGQLENTIFVYTSDHGESLGEHGLWLKNNLYDVGSRVPLVLAGVGVPRGSVVETPVAHVDLIRTFLEWGKAKTHRKLRGHSLIPLMQGKPGEHPGWAYSESHSEGNCTGSFLIRKGDWKYIHFTWYDGLLFNIADDPGELKNRFEDPAAQGILKELQGILHTQVDPVAVTERAFRAQKQRMDRLAATLTKNQMLDQCRSRLGEGQAVALLTAYYGQAFPYDHKSDKEGSGREQ